MYLLDTMVLSELRKHNRDASVTQWIRARPQHELFISVISIGEIERGIAKQRRVNPEFAAKLTGWLERTTSAYGERILPITSAVARLWGRLTIEYGRTDADVLIAATAIQHNLTVVTHNVKHFQAFDISVHNPFNGSTE